jgi:hypothetical protein
MWTQVCHRLGNSAREVGLCDARSVLDHEKQVHNAGLCSVLDRASTYCGIMNSATQTF